jgi:nitrogen regulatory protein PII
MREMAVMKYYKAKKVVIVTEACILDDIIRALQKLGVRGYTIIGATGQGERGRRLGNGVTSLHKNVKIEVVINSEVAQNIVVEILDNFFVHYAGIIYLEDVEVVQAKKARLPE